MTADEAIGAVLVAFEQATIPYMIVGSLASNFHGVPRSTRDADFVVDLVPGALEGLARALPPVLIIESQGAFEAVTGTTRYVITLRGSPFVCELFLRSDDPHDRERFTRRQQVRVLGQTAWVATAEDMIVTKLRWARDAGRLKDRDDIRSIIAVRDAELDWRPTSIAGRRCTARAASWPTFCRRSRRGDNAGARQLERNCGNVRAGGRQR